MYCAKQRARAIVDGLARHRARGQRETREPGLLRVGRDRGRRHLRQAGDAFERERVADRRTPVGALHDRGDPEDREDRCCREPAEAA